MKKLCILAKEKIVLPVTKEVNILLAELDTLNVPWYIYDDSVMKATIMSNCDNKSIQNAKNHILVAKKRKAYYCIVLNWWAGHQVYGSYSTHDEAARYLANRSQTYRGNGYFSIEEKEKTEKIEVTEPVLVQIVSDYNNLRDYVSFEWE